MKFKAFLASENGAIAVEWVVITAGLVGLGLATASVVSGGVEDVSNDINSALTDQGTASFFGSVLDAVTAATAGMTLTSVWDTPGQWSNEFTHVDRLSFASDIVFNSGDEGIIVEGGGQGRGFIMYQHDGFLYLQAGDGSGYGESATRGEASWEVVDGTHSIEASMNADGGLALYVNGTLVDQSSFQAASLTGGDSGTISGGTNSVSANRGGFNRSDPGHPGVSEVNFFGDQTTGDELVPMT